VAGRIILVLSAPINQSQNPYTSVLSDTASFGALRGVCIALYNQVWTDRVTVGLDETTTRWITNHDIQGVRRSLGRLSGRT